MLRCTVDSHLLCYEKSNLNWILKISVLENVGVFWLGKSSDIITTGSENVLKQIESM